MPILESNSTIGSHWCTNEFVFKTQYYLNYQTYLLILIEDADDKMKLVHSQAGSSLIQQKLFFTLKILELFTFPYV